MISFLKCIGLKDSSADIDPIAAEEEAARRKQEREDAKQVLRRSVKKASRRGVGFYSPRDVYVTEDELALAYAKPNAMGAEKTLPFAEMNPPQTEGKVVVVTMRNQAASTATYNFQLPTAADADAWAAAINKFLPEGIVAKPETPAETPPASDPKPAEQAGETAEARTGEVETPPAAAAA